MSGKLVLVATPIGNLGDMTVRGAETLRNADVIACEDTRHTRKLLNHLEIRGVPLISVHQHNEVVVASQIAERIRGGETVALVTDAGMPAVSDPGERLVAEMVAQGLEVSVVPGPSASTAALAASGLSTSRFTFEGFLPRKGVERKRRIASIVDRDHTTVLYEAPHRLAATVVDLADAAGDDRLVALGRELTKLHEEVWRGTLGGLRARLEQGSVKGECVLVIDGRAQTLGTEVTDEEIRLALIEETDRGASRKDAAAIVATFLGISRKRAYDLSHD